MNTENITGISDISVKFPDKAKLKNLFLELYLKRKSDDNI